LVWFRDLEISFGWQFFFAADLLSSWKSRFPCRARNLFTSSTETAKFKFSAFAFWNVFTPISVLDSENAGSLASAVQLSDARHIEILCAWASWCCHKQCLSFVKKRRPEPCLIDNGSRPPKLPGNAGISAYFLSATPSGTDRRSLLGSADVSFRSVTAATRRHVLLVRRDRWSRCGGPTHN
jgi:hypothetical protein